MKRVLLIQGCKYTVVGITWAIRCERDRIKVSSLGPSIGENCGQKESFRTRLNTILHHNGSQEGHLSSPKITRYLCIGPGGETLFGFISPTAVSCPSECVPPGVSFLRSRIIGKLPWPRVAMISWHSRAPQTPLRDPSEALQRSTAKTPSTFVRRDSKP